MHIFLRVLLWLNSHLITQYHLSFLSLHKIARAGTIPIQSSCWKRPFINQHQQGKIQTQISKECKEKSNPVKSKYFLSATSSQDQQRKKSRGDKPAIYFLLESSLFGFTVFSHCFGSPCYIGGPQQVAFGYMNPWVPLWGQLCSDTNSWTAATGTLLFSPICGLEGVHDLSKITQAVQDRHVREHGSSRGIAVSVTVVSKAQLTTRSTTPACTTSWRSFRNHDIEILGYCFLHH